jgi:peptidyl-prolyl cis-trans isomerase SurA
MQQYVCTCTAVLLVSALAWAQTPDLTQLDIVERAVPDGPVALVDNTPISNQDFLNRYRFQRELYLLRHGKDSLPDPMRVKLGIQVLNELIEREILLAEGQRRKITVSNAEVDKEFASTMQRLATQISEKEGRTPSEDEILQKIGETRESAKERVRRDLILDKVRDAIAAEKAQPVTDEEIQSFYKENTQLFQQSSGVHIRQIFVRPKPNAQKATEAAWAEAQQRIEKAAARIRAGETFEAVAREVSESADKEKGGDWGFVKIEDLPEAFREPVAHLQPGQISGVIRSEHGLHLIQLVEKQEGTHVSLDEAKPRIAEAIRKANRDFVVEEFCQKAWQDSDRVKVFLPLQRLVGVLDGQATARGHADTAPQAASTPNTPSAPSPNANPPSKSKKEKRKK